MRSILLSLILLLSACTLYGGADDADQADAAPPAPANATAIDQCVHLAGLFCTSAEACGWDANTGPCREYYGAMCQRNQTVVNQQTLDDAEFNLGNYSCPDDERWVLWEDPQGASVLDAMLTWPATGETNP
jgi:hypothetical protein